MAIRPTQLQIRFPRPTTLTGRLGQRKYTKVDGRLKRHKRFHAWRKQDRQDRWEKYRSEKLWTKYRITSRDYDELCVAQNYVCAICCRPAVGGKSLCVDHDHSTGKVRGLLCNNCNMAVGYLADDPLRGESLAAYLRGCNHR